MMFELVVWHVPAPVGVAEAAAADLAALPASPRVEAFAAELARAAPDAAVAAPGSRYARVRMTPERVDEISPEVYALAREHGLIVYDPERGLVHNLEPLGVHEGMQLHTGDGLVVADPDLGLIHDALGRLGPASPFAALVVFGRHFVQTSPEDGVFELEYKDSVRGVLSRTTASGLDDVRRAFREYAIGDDAFLARHDWTRVPVG
ncbi:hypothetical protein [Actinomadura atramentaria]|uniref:hypothetical protein n=1 Tax=Actinomadura atramentaria TaxID=1990 RepID=UPI00036F3F39|nr:hypothetical protein [Actinomadura atramentaria]